MKAIQTFSAIGLIAIAGLGDGALDAAVNQLSANIVSVLAGAAICCVVCLFVISSLNHRNSRL